MGMVHVDALPGAPRSGRAVADIARRAAEEARVLRTAGFDAVVIENMHDRPYVHGTQEPQITAAMTRAGLAVREALGDLPLGVQILSGGNREALAVALAVEAAFIRCENFVFAHVADEGLLTQAEAGPLLRYRRQIGAEHIKVLADIKKKHASHAITADVPLDEAAAAAEFFGADGLVITGVATGKPTAPADLALARKGSKLPLVVGSGASPEQLESLFRHADAVIVGSWIKAEGLWSNPVDERRAHDFVLSARAIA